MSRTGRKPINVPAGVDVAIDGSTVTVKGKLGTLVQSFNPEMTIEKDGAVVSVKRGGDEARLRSLHGLTRTLIDNMVVGVSTGFKKELEINGVGYRAQKQGNNLVMNLGYSHQIIMPEQDGISIEVPNPNRVIISGPDRQKVGQFAAEVRGKRPPEPYKGKGIKYVGETIIRKEGKAGKGKK